MGRTPSTRKRRLDELLVEQGWAENPAKAQALVMTGKVLVNEQRADKPAILVSPEAVIRVKGMTAYVSRGGQKLAGALADFDLIEWVTGKHCLDIGSSTGGFTDCLLQQGAAKVTALDVGTNQLAWKLRTDPRVLVREKTDIRDLSADDANDIHFVVADISFQSLARLLEPILNRTRRPGMRYLLLVKPQFELPREHVPDGGVVLDAELQKQAVARVLQVCADLGIENTTAKPCQVLGRSGNQEYFIYFCV